MEAKEGVAGQTGLFSIVIYTAAYRQEAQYIMLSTPFRVISWM